MSLLLLKSTCFIGLLIHNLANFYGYFFSPTTWVNIADVRLGDLKEVPLVLQVIINEGFDERSLNAEGYRNIED